MLWRRGLRIVQKAVTPTPLIPPKRNSLPERGCWLGGNPAAGNHTSRWLFPENVRTLSGLPRAKSASCRFSGGTQPMRLLSVTGDNGLTSVPELPPSHLGLLAVPSKMLGNLLKTPFCWHMAELSIGPSLPALTLRTKDFRGGKRDRRNNPRMAMMANAELA
jgi:hypothetical protein